MFRVHSYTLFVQIRTAKVASQVHIHEWQKPVLTAFLRIPHKAQPSTTMLLREQLQIQVRYQTP